MINQRYRRVLGVPLFLAIAALASACSTDEKSAPAAGTSATSPAASGITPATSGPVGNNGHMTTKLGEKATFEDSEWQVVEAKDAGKELKLGDGWKGGPPPVIKTEGRFILVKFKVTNRGKAEAPKPSADLPKLVDSQGREFKRVHDDVYRFPSGSKVMDYDVITAGMTNMFVAAYETPEDAKDLKLKAFPLGTPEGNQSALMSLGI